MTPDLIVESAADGVLLLRLNRPERRNALATPLLCAIAGALTAADADDAIRVVIITGSDSLFAAGADVDELAASTGDDPIESPRFQAWAAIRSFSKPLIAAVEGWCLGAGLELALRCDLIVAGAKARFGLPETNLGIMPGAGGTAILPRLVGLRRAMAMVLTGEPIGAEEAQRAGLITQTVADGEAADAATALAAKLAARAPNALRTAKASLRQATELPLDDHLLSERRAFVGLLGGAEKTEGIAAFREKRPAVWR